MVMDDRAERRNHVVVRALAIGGIRAGFPPGGTALQPVRDHVAHGALRRRDVGAGVDIERDLPEMRFRGPTIRK
jgi:hypothetical protein